MRASTPSLGMGAQPAKLELETFLDALASANPIPGGGSAAALSGAIAAALVGMVCRVTHKSQHEVEDDELGGVAHRADEIRRELMTLIELDGGAYRRVMDAMKSKQPQAIQPALVYATETPLRTAALCGETLTLAATIANKIRKSTRSDLSVGALIAQGALRGAIVTAETNLRDIQDEKFVNAQRTHIAQMTKDAEKELTTVLTNL